MISDLRFMICGRKSNHRFQDSTDFFGWKKRAEEKPRSTPITRKLKLLSSVWSVCSVVKNLLSLLPHLSNLRNLWIIFSSAAL